MPLSFRLAASIRHQTDWTHQRTRRTREDPGSAVNLLIRTPIHLAPFTRRIPAATSGLRSPVSAAS